MKTILKIKNGEYTVSFVRFRGKDFDYGNRSTATIVTDLEYAAIVALFSEPGEWSIVRQYEPKTDADGNVVYQEPDIVTDCTDYEKLLSIKDTRTGVFEVVLGKATDGEILAELLEELNR